MTEEVKDDELLSEEELQAKYGENNSVLENEEPSKEESPDTETETAVPVVEEETTETPDTETETAEESTEETAESETEILERLGLSGQYNTVEEALKANKDAQTEINRFRREQSDRERYQPPDPNPQLEKSNREALKQRIADDPDGMIEQIFNVLDQQQTTVNNLQAQNLLSQAQVQFPDIVKRKSEIDKVIEKDPVLRYTNTIDPGWTAKMARSIMIADNPVAPESTKKKVLVKAVSDDDKAKATTTSGKGQTPKRKAGKREQSDWDSMSIEEMEKDSEIGIKED